MAKNTAAAGKRSARACQGWPHDYDPNTCPHDYEQFKTETLRQQTTMGERSQQRMARHAEAGET